MNDHRDNAFPAIMKAEIEGQSVQTVNARDLYAFLDSKRDSSDWMRERIELYGFAQDTDFIVVPQICGGTDKDGYPRASKRIDYHLSLDMAKEISMVERNEKGKQVRQYFIECERRAQAAQQFDPATVLQSPAAMRGLLLSYTEKVIELEEHVAELLPKADALGRLAESEGSFCITDAAKTLQVQPKALFSFLRSHRWIYTRAGSSTEIAFQDKLASGLLGHKTTTVHRSDGSEKTATQVRVTPKGLARLAQEFPPVAQVA